MKVPGFRTDSRRILQPWVGVALFGGDVEVWFPGDAQLLLSSLFSLRQLLTHIYSEPISHPRRITLSSNLYFDESHHEGSKELEGWSHNQLGGDRCMYPFGADREGIQQNDDRREMRQ